MKKNIEYFLCKVKSLISKVSIIEMDHYPMDGWIEDLRYFISCFKNPPIPWYSLDSIELNYIMKILEELSQLLNIIIICDISELVQWITEFNASLAFEMNRIDLTVVEISKDTNNQLNIFYSNILRGLRNLDLNQCVGLTTTDVISLDEYFTRQSLLHPKPKQEIVPQPIIYYQYIPPFYFEESNEESPKTECKIFRILFYRLFSLVRIFDLKKEMKINKIVKVRMNEQLQTCKTKNFHDSLFLIAKENDKISYFMMKDDLFQFKKFYCDSFFFHEKWSIKILILQK